MDLELLLGDAGEIRLEDVGILGLTHLEARREAARSAPRVEALKGVTAEQSVHDPKRIERRLHGMTPRKLTIVPANQICHVRDLPAWK